MPTAVPAPDGSVLLLKLSPTLQQLIQKSAPAPLPRITAPWNSTPPLPGGAKTFIALAPNQRSGTRLISPALSLSSASGGSVSAGQPTPVASLTPHLGTLGSGSLLAHIAKPSPAQAQLLPEAIKLPATARVAFDEFCDQHCPQLGTVLGVVGLVQQSRKLVELVMRKDPQLYLAVGWEGAKTLIEATKLIAPALGFTAVANAACWTGVIIDVVEESGEQYYALAGAQISGKEPLTAYSR